MEAKYFDYNRDKNIELKNTRGIGFEDIITLIKSGYLLDDVLHSNSNKYPNQRMMIVDVSGYCYVVPYVEDSNRIFLKTIIPSRKVTKKYKCHEEDK